MPTYYVSQGGGSIGSGSYRGIWVASQTYVAGDRVVPTRTYATAAAKFYIYECTTGGQSGGSEPTWVYASPGTSTTTDNAATWTCRACTTWANANIYLSYMHENDAAGDIFYVKNDLSESYAGAITMDWAGTAASPTRIICVSDTGEPPTTVATGAVVATTGANNLTISSATDYVYVYGVRFKAGDSTNAADVNVNGDSTFESCAFELAGNNAGSDFLWASALSVYLMNCTIKSANASSVMTVPPSMLIYNGGIESGGTPGTPVFSGLPGSSLSVFGFDFVNLSSSGNISSSSGSAGSHLRFTNCKLPSSWSGSANTGAIADGSYAFLSNCDSTDTNYRLELVTQFGTVTHETTLVRTGGASNGTTGISWKMVSGADAEWSHQTLDTPEIVRWNETTGSSITVTVEFLRDSATNLKDNELWLEVQYLGTSGFPLASKVSDAAATYLTTAADQTDSSETWTTTGMSNPNTQKMSVSFTPQEKGYIHAVVRLAKASTTVYVDPMLTVT